MSGISSGVGLISGLPTAELIAQLMAIESRPLLFLQGQIGDIQAERTAFADLSARLLALKNSIARFDQPAFFDVFQANSSDPNVLTAIAGPKATPGSFAFQIHSLVSNHELISQGFADADTTPVGIGTLSLEMGHGLLDPGTDLDLLNGGEGMRRGRIEITDRAGNVAEIDLTAVLTVNDVIEAINSRTAIEVRARVAGDRIIIEDLGDTTLAGSLTVRDLAGGHAAEDLGLAQSATADVGEALSIQSADVLNLADSTLLSMLNDGNGVGRAAVGADFTIQRDDGAAFDISLSGNIDGNTHLNVLNSGNGVRLGVIRITTRNGDSAEVDLSGAVNLQDVVDAIEGSGLDVGVTYFNSSARHALQLSDNTESAVEGEGTFKIEDVSGFAARDLGVATEADEGSIIGNGIHRITTVGDVMRAIQYAYDKTAGEYNNGRIVASISANGNGLVLGSLGTPRGFEVVTGADSTAAADLGIVGRYDNGVPPDGAGRDLVAGLNTVLLRSLNGGSGLATGQVRIADRSGAAVEVDLTGAQTVQQVIDRINEQALAAGVQVTASVNPVGNGLIVRDETGLVANDLVIEDVAGTMAADLGIAGNHAADHADSGNLQLQYVSAQTLLADLNGGRGVRTGRFRITDTTGAVHTVNITDNQRTVGDVIKLINAAGANLVASINATGDGLLVTDSAGGDGTLKIEDQDGFAARDLNLAGEAEAGQSSIDGSFELHVEIDADDTLNEVVAKINDLGADYSAAVLNDGSPINPYRLVVTSQVGGARGRMVFDGGATGLGLETLAEARDAVVFFGGSDVVNPLVIRSSSNTLSDVIEGVTIDLQSPSDQPVDLAISQDVDGIVAELQDFVEAYNDVLGRIDELTSFDAESLTRGVLFGDSTVSQIENRLFRSVTRQFEGVSTSVSHLSNIGLTYSDGRLGFDESRFREAYNDDPDAVEQLFTAEETGFGDVFEQILDDMTRGADGLIAVRDSSLEKQEELLQDRIEATQDLLDLKRARLERQFSGLESALALLQGQQTALTNLQNLAYGA